MLDLGFEWRKCGEPLLDLGVADFQFELAGLGIDVNAVARLNGRNRAAGRGFRRDVANTEAARAAGEAAVGDQCATDTGATMAAVGESISCMPGPPRGPS